ncbi:sigma-70 family RNA polymerase sigma factor [Mucilaginibacter sp. Bleaf8]|uniref:RNA polymerase sigma factor n=1 Tax=Mucilaginibacter sp. Bleaf8 TaxID=2834430 RepID=UPI001BCAA2D0|nr:sigma-70 family RNA polymerase sigma factor [Mucilaginibacter sp. Bleaf8]MBS7565967.1 sigma-70 family RNA polymerase sigma factor [Mucilaginibacter sp. Bleaf8]
MFNEEDIVHRIIRGDLRAFSVLVAQYEKLVFHVINRMVNDEQDKEDICQEVFIKVHHNLSKFRFESKLSTWIARIAYLTAINYLKKYRKPMFADQVQEVDNYYFTHENPQELLVKKDMNAYVNFLIGKMPEQYRIVLTLFHLEEFSYQEVGDITGMPEGTVKNYLFRARKLLKEQLEIYFSKEEL